MLVEKRMLSQGDFFRSNYLTVSAVLSDAEFSSLGWGKGFRGTTQEYDEVRGRVLDAQGEPLDGMTGPAGYIAYADAHAVGKMDKAYVTVSAVLSDGEFTSLGWGKAFQGTTHEYGEVRGWVLDAQGKPLDGMTGPAGYIAYANAHTIGKMQKAYATVSALLSDAEFASLGWGKQFIGTTQEYGEVRGRVLDAQGEPLDGMTGPAGYLAYANTHTVGKMQKAYLTVSAVLSDAEFSSLGWGKGFRGTTQEYDEVRGRVLDAQGEPLDGMTGPAGYIAYANAHTVGKMDKAYLMVSAILSDGEFASLGWGKQFIGSTQEYGEVRGRVLDAQGKPLDGMTGPAGYIAYANAHTIGKMQKAYATVSALLSDAEFASLGWGKQFIGTTQDYGNFRRLLISASREFNPKAHGKDGLDFIAWSLVVRSGDRKKDRAAYAKARINLRAVLSEGEIIDFGWPKAQPKR